MGPDLTDSAADKARHFAWQLAVAVGYELETSRSADEESRFRIAVDILDEARIQNATATLTGAARNGETGTYEVTIDAAAGRGGGWFSEEAVVRMCVRYVVDLTGDTPVEPERAECEGDEAETPDRYVEVHF